MLWHRVRKLLDVSWFDWRKNTSRDISLGTQSILKIKWNQWITKSEGHSSQNQSFTRAGKSIAYIINNWIEYPIIRPTACGPQPISQIEVVEWV